MSLFEPEFGLIFWMLVVFLIVFAILAKYGWPFIIRSLEERADFIDEGVKFSQEARDAKQQAENEKQQLLAEAHRQQLAVLQETERMKQRMIADAKNAAGVEAQKVMDGAKIAVEQAKKEAELQMNKQVALLSLQIAEKVIRKDLESDEAQADLINRFLDETQRGDADVIKE